MGEGLVMRSIAFAGMLAAAICGFAPVAGAGVIVDIKRTQYEVTGQSGTALLDAMDRRGPKHGFLTRAIAQTRYSVGWNIVWAQKNGACRVKQANARLSMTYTYPVLDGDVPLHLRKQWVRFMKGVVRHEETHGNIARQMVSAAERSVSGLAFANDPACRNAKAEAKRRVDRIYAKYEMRQVIFDRKEHGEGGNVEALVTALRD
jgi:predicted secreted Zn-dependent protease